MKTLLSLILFSSLTHAKEFSNSYLKFDIPERWTCKLIAPAWECTVKTEKKRQHAIIILAAKDISDRSKLAHDDSIEGFESVLKNPNHGSFAARNPGKGKVVYIKRSQINGDNWVDSVHENSEVEDFLTRYLATTKNDLAILVSLSMRSSMLSKYENDFMEVIKSIKTVK